MQMKKNPPGNPVSLHSAMAYDYTAFARTALDLLVRTIGARSVPDRSVSIRPHLVRRASCGQGGMGKRLHSRIRAKTAAVLATIALTSCLASGIRGQDMTEQRVATPAPVARVAPRYETLEASAWKPLPWCGYRFVFQAYADNWGEGSRYQRAGHEADVQKLLTPVWEDPNYKNTHRIPGLHEWAWSHLEKKWGGQSKRECYEMAKAWYVRERDRKVGGPYGTHTGPDGQPVLFTSMTGHGWLVHGPAEWGMDWLGIEIGENIVGTQLHIAFQRGAARMFHLPTHADVSQWFYGTVPDFVAGVDEFTQMPLDRDAVMAGIAKGGIGLHNGGHSSSSHARMWFVCWLSGVTVVCPEDCRNTFFAHSPEYRRQHSSGRWGATLDGYDRDTRVELSSYGKRAKRFYAITQKHPEIGIPYTPFAVLLDKYSGFHGFQKRTGHPWGVRPPGDGDRSALEFFNTVFPESIGRVGLPEQQRLVASVCGDTFDVLVTGVGSSLLNLYPVVIALGEHEFLPETVQLLQRYVAAGGELVCTEAHATQLGPAFAALQQSGKVRLFDDTSEAGRNELLVHLRDSCLPVAVSGHVEYLINRTPTGWVVGLVNNEGVTKKRMTATVVDRSKDQTVTVTLRQGHVTAASEWFEDRPLKVVDNAVTVTVPAGEVRIVEFCE